MRDPVVENREIWGKPPHSGFILAVCDPARTGPVRVLCLGFPICKMASRSLWSFGRLIVLCSAFDKNSSTWSALERGILEHLELLCQLCPERTQNRTDTWSSGFCFVLKWSSDCYKSSAPNIKMCFNLLFSLKWVQHPGYGVFPSLGFKNDNRVLIRDCHHPPLSSS